MPSFQMHIREGTASLLCALDSKSSTRWSEVNTLFIYNTLAPAGAAAFPASELWATR